MTEHVKAEIADGIMTLTLQRPEKKNALTGAMYDALSDALKQAEADTSVRVVLFQGDGGSFTAGNDLADFARQARGESARCIRRSGDCGSRDQWTGAATGVGHGAKWRASHVVHCVSTAQLCRATRACCQSIARSTICGDQATLRHLCRQLRRQARQRML